MTINNDTNINELENNTKTSSEYSSESVKDADAKKRFNKNRNNNNKDFQKSDLSHTVVFVKRVTNVLSKGRTLSFLVKVICGDQKGKVGYGTGKAKEVIDAKNKALNDAKKNMVYLKLFENRTIFHDQDAKAGASRVLLRKAKRGTGIIAGAPIRILCTHAGIKDIVSKSLGSRNTRNVIRAAMKALCEVNSFHLLAKRRDLVMPKSDTSSVASVADSMTE